jgi:hydrogenase maturation protein HypF
MHTARRLRLEIQGAVQGVGFRPLVYRLATELGLRGWVLNDARGVVIEVEGVDGRLEEFRHRVEAEPPVRAVVDLVRGTWLDAADFPDFRIRHSDRGGSKEAVVLPDVAMCSLCRADVDDHADRRHRYAFTNCTDCGPRFTIIEALPYDRPNTTMRRFDMCEPCRREYEDPSNRRFHAQPNACASCGPQLELWDGGGRPAGAGDEALQLAMAALHRGQILAVKGLGGFHLMVDARDPAAVTRLRERKARYEKPLALMVGAVEDAERLCEVPPDADALLSSPEAPIVLLRRLPGSPVADEVAPDNPYLGVMLPYTPLHHLLVSELGFPVVATSGNLSDEPICIESDEARTRLDGIADLYLVHDRPIARHADDSVVCLMAGDAQPIRRARGYAPLPVILDAHPKAAPSILAVGAHLKNTVALSVGRRVFISQHIGDMETPQAVAVFERVIRDFLEMYEAAPVAVARDLHPDYASTQWIERLADGAAAGQQDRVADGSAAGKGDRVADGSTGAKQDVVWWARALRGLPRITVQHHHAHLASCLADNDSRERALGVIWDGTGYGPDGTVWGGEFLLGDAAGFERVAWLRPFRLLGGEAAVREPRRAATAVLAESLERGHGEREVWGREDLPPIATLTHAERRTFERMLDTGFRSPITTSVGRLFDAIASLLDIRQRASFEGQAAMQLEYVADPDVRDAYPVEVTDSSSALVLDWRPIVRAALEDSGRGVDRGVISARFHNGLVGAIVEVAGAIAEPTVALSGGCFQNRLLTERARERLMDAGFRVLVHRRVPANDGGISLGQVAVAAARRASGDDGATAHDDGAGGSE